MSGKLLHDLKKELAEITAENAQYAAEHQLGVPPIEMIRLTLREIIDEAYPTETEKIELDLKVQRKLKAGLQEAAKEAEKQREQQRSGLVIPKTKVPEDLQQPTPGKMPGDGPPGLRGM